MLGVRPRAAPVVPIDESLSTRKMRISIDSTSMVVTTSMASRIRPVFRPVRLIESRPVCRGLKG